ncbi:uncharacterized protein LOC101856598 [Aplysia californica]|uniref:Uncharacterized protein LOC101856598 n=1 Tax=Aplysia californica TaxID=6500 RepID=A0ABM0JZY8_APLCA|nr:uncharacterized protein LOC101856598 [Aplysia californica]
MCRESTRIVCLLITACLRYVAAHDECGDHVFPGETDVDIKLPAIFGMRQSEEGICQSWSKIALQQAIALNWVTSLLNGANSSSNETFIPGVKFGIDVYDDCMVSYLTARHAGDIASKIKRSNMCSLNETNGELQPVIAGVLGTSVSQTTTILADILKSTHVPVLGISATLPELGDKSKYPGFLRTVPSDLKQAQTIIELAKKYKWTYIVGVHTTDNYGRQGMSEVHRLARQNSICLSFLEAIDTQEQPSRDKMETFVRQTLFGRVAKSRDTLGVIYFGLQDGLLNLLRFIKERRSAWHNAQYYMEKIHFIASDAVGPSEELNELLQEYKSKIILVSPPKADVKSFEDHFFSFLSSPPPWASGGSWQTAMKRIIREEYSCPGYNFTAESLESCNLQSKVRFYGYLTAALDSVYLIANTVRALHQNLCNNPGMCTALRTLLESGVFSNYEILDLNYNGIREEFLPWEFANEGRHLQNVSGDFQSIDGVLYSLQTNQGAGYEHIGTYKNGSVFLLPGIPAIMEPSECKEICSEPECEGIDKMHFLYQEGSVIILGFYSVHWGSDGFGCGDFRDESMSYVALSAFLNSIKNLRKSTGTNFGYLILDDCYNPLTASRMVVKVLSGDLNITDPVSGQRFDPQRVTVAVGAQSSPVTMAVLPVLRALGIPLISYSSTNPDLDNRNTYPYFSRTVSSDAIQSKVIKLILEQLKVTYVGAMIIQNSYGLGLFDLFRNMAEEEQICVDDPFEMTKDTPIEEIRAQLAKYRDKRIQVVVAFAMDTIASKILEAVTQDDTFVFVASEAWGPNPSIIEGFRGERARGSLVLGVSTALELNYGLKDYMSRIHPFHTDSDVWLKEFWQAYFRCDMPGGFDNTHNIVCKEEAAGQNYFSVQDLQDLTTSPLSVHSTIATMSAGTAVQSLFNANERLPFDPEKITLAIRNVNLQSSTGFSFSPFLPDGNGNGGFEIYSVQPEGSSFVYKLVGNYTNSQKLSLDWSKVKFYGETGREVDSLTSSCLYQSSCKVCAHNPTSTPSVPAGSTEAQQSPPDNDSSSSALVIALGIVIALLALVIIAVIIAVIFFCKKKSFWKDRTYTEPGKVVYITESSVASSHHSNQYTAVSGSSQEHPVPPPPPTARSSSSVGQNKDGVINRAFSDILIPGAQVHVEPRTRSGSQSQENIAGGGYSTSSDDRSRSEVSSEPPLPRPHMPMNSIRTDSPLTSNTSDSSNSQVRYITPSTHHSQPRFFLHEGDISSQVIEAPPVGSTIYGNLPHDGHVVGAAASVAAPQNQIVFDNVHKVYTLDSPIYSAANNLYSTKPAYWLVKQADDNLVPYENLAPGADVVAGNSSYPAGGIVSPQTVTFPQELVQNQAVVVPNNQTLPLNNPVVLRPGQELILGVDGIPSLCDRSGRVGHSGVDDDPHSYTGLILSPPAPHRTRRAVSNDYITPIPPPDSDFEQAERSHAHPGHNMQDFSVQAESPGNSTRCDDGSSHKQRQMSPNTQETFAQNQQTQQVNEKHSQIPTNDNCEIKGNYSAGIIPPIVATTDSRVNASPVNGHIPQTNTVESLTSNPLTLSSFPSSTTYNASASVTQADRSRSAEPSSSEESTAIQAGSPIRDPTPPHDTDVAGNKMPGSVALQDSSNGVQRRLKVLNSPRTSQSPRVSDIPEVSSEV